MENLTTFLEARISKRLHRSEADKKYSDEYGTFFNISDNYHTAIPVKLACNDWGNGLPKNQPKGSVVIGDKGELKGKVIITPDGENKIYDEIKKLASTHGDYELYVKVKYHGDDSYIYPLYKVDEDDDAVYVSVAPNVRIQFK